MACRRVPDGGVLDGGADNGPAGTSLDRTPDGGVDGLRSSAGEDDLAGTRAEQPGDAGAGILDRHPGDAALGVHPTGVGRTVAGEPGEHGLDHLGAARGGGGVIEIVTAHGLLTRRSRGSAPHYRAVTQVSSPRARDEMTTGVLSP